MNTEHSIELGFREGSSDKVYRACIEEAAGGFLVNFAYGRRGATLNTGTKTQQPVAYDEALNIYEQLVKSKTSKGYKPANGAQAGQGIGSSVTDRERRDTGLRAQLLNPITEDEVRMYLDNHNWCAQEKFDGRRMLLRKSGTDVVAANRDGLSIGFPDVIAGQLTWVKGDVVIDGECVGDTFYAFDLLECCAKDFRNKPYRDRLEMLQKQFTNLDGAIIVARTVTGWDKAGFIASLKRDNKEGVVFKDLRACWSAGRPASGGSAIKCKFWASCSCVVGRVNARRSVEITLGGVSVGNVTIPPNHSIPAVGQVVEIRYLYVTGVGGSLYQPIFQGVRDDVPVEECTVERQRIKYKPVEE